MRRQAQWAQLWRYDDVDWADGRCYHCMFRQPLEVLVDGEPMCCDCADLWLERQVAIEIYPAMRELLPPLWER